MLHARIASALRKIIFNTSPKGESVVKSSELKNTIDSWEGDNLLTCFMTTYMIYDHFEGTEAYDAAQGLSDLFNICLQNDDGQDFDPRWDPILSGTTEMRPENVLEGLYKKKLQVSEQLQTMLAMYNQELNRDHVIPSCQKWWTWQDNILIRR